MLIGAPARTAEPAARLGLRAFLPGDIVLDGRSLPDVAGAALLLEPGESPHALGYALFLGGVRVRVGRSAEFGGLSLSTRFAPDADDDTLIDALLAGVAA